MSNYHRQHQHIRIHLWPPNTHHTIQGNKKDPRAPQDHPKDTLALYYGKKPTQSVDSHGFFLCRWYPFSKHQTKEDIFQVGPSMQHQIKTKLYLG